MPKRTNPFGDSSPLQFKSHIRQKEVDMGVLREENMKAVYEKTKQLLFTGARKLKQPGQGSGLMDTSEIMADVCQKDLHLAPGQLCLSNSGKLAAPASLGFVNGFCNNNTLLANPQLSVSANPLSSNKGSNFTCKSCSRAFIQIRPCHFCEGTICVDCTRRCDICSGNFCSFCSVLNYDHSSERAFCLNCSS
ncbi:apoptosis regulatory protein Siva-like [Liolophura sinensis]|uniref:apoptosis regulatory protein Siva-like n=1 Tax=Liolophura sinensis TaxID=3198878 RepID=UPI003158086E